jgi:hypothetical protein
MPLSLRLTILLTATALAAPAAALATPPETDTIVVDETFVYPVGSTDNPCPFELTYHNSGTFIVTTHLDADGTTVRQFARGTDFLETYSANGKEISSITPATIHFDPATNTLVGTGNQRHFIVPGAGVVYAQAGRFVIDVVTGDLITSSGLDIPLDAEICTALTP